LLIRRSLILPKAIALLSGGLDSTLAVLVMKRLGVDVTAITFLTHFGCNISDTSSCSKDPFPAAEKYGFTVKLCHLADKFIEIVKNPRHGHGKNMNPCIDCRILMLREAKEMMRLTGADFIVTGEVLGQRPMSQRKETFPMIDREAGVKGYVLRPLSARLLPETIMEKDGMVDREKLYAFNGRTRKPQMALAEELGLTDYPNPAGGCLLTEPNYAWRLKELLSVNKTPTLRELNLLKLGRHFRASGTSKLNEVKIIAGRDEEENNLLEKFVDGEIYMRAENWRSPLVLVTGTPSQSDILTAASICARYSDHRHLPAVSVNVYREGAVIDSIFVSPAEEALIESLRIQKPEKPLKARG
jgi:tRNA-specific 2-thiouridylase